jgi:hypothetical protein
MKKTLFLLAILSTGLVTRAQKIPLARATPVSKSVEVAKEGTVTSFETNLVPGRLSLTKAFQKGDGQVFEVAYALVKNNDASFNNRKPVRIALNRKSFDSVFTKVSSEVAGKFNILNKYVQDNSLSLNEEKGWISLVKYYNSLQGTL